MIRGDPARVAAASSSARGLQARRRSLAALAIVLAILASSSACHFLLAGPPCDDATHCAPGDVCAAGVCVRPGDDGGAPPVDGGRGRVDGGAADDDAGATADEDGGAAAIDGGDAADGGAASDDGGAAQGDGGATDGGGDDAGPADAGIGDAGADDAGPGDAGPGDAGPADAGPVDAGPVDAGPPDAGLVVTIVVPIASALHDGYEGTDGVIYAAYDWLSIYGETWGGLLFEIDEIPQGADVQHAHLRGFVDSRLEDHVDMLIGIQDDDRPAPLVQGGATAQISARTYGPFGVSWVDDDLLGGPDTAETPGTWVESPELAPLIQRVVDRADWGPGDAVFLALRGRTAGFFELRQYEHGAVDGAFATELHVRYVVP